MDLKHIALMTMTGVFLSACGGGGGGDSSDSGSAVSQVNASTMDGIYVGTGTESGFGGFELIAYIQGGDIYAISDTGVGYTGPVTTRSDNSYSMSLKLYDPSDNEAFDQASVSGTYSSQSSFEGSYNRTTGPTGSFSAQYSAEAYEQPASTELISGAWRVDNSIDNASLTINSNGEFFGSDEVGCVFSGSITVPNANRNLYRINFTQENCGSLNGTYNGLAARAVDTSGTHLLALVGNANMGFIYDLVKQ